MTRHHATFSDKVRDAVGYVIAIFVFLPGLLGILGLVSGMRVSLLVGLLTIYYLVAIVAVLFGGLAWLERHLS